MFADREVKPEDYAWQGGQQVKAKKERKTFPCQSCGGTGVYRAPRVHQEKAHCFPCGGKGFFYQSEGDRLKARRSTRKAGVLTCRLNTHTEPRPTARTLDRSSPPRNARILMKTAFP